VKNTEKSTCGSVLQHNSSCQLAVILRPNQLGQFNGDLKVCAGNGLWCSRYPNGLAVTVTEKEIVSTNCHEAQTRPFSDLTCRGAKQFSDNFESFIQQVLKQSTTHRQFHYFQHQPSVDETTVPCLEARQAGEILDPNIQGGGIPLCDLMGYALSNARPNHQSESKTKQFPPYLTRLLGTSYPITDNTVPLDQLDALRSEFNTSFMDESLQNVGYTGHVTFLSEYYQQQLGKVYTQCSESDICSSIFYLPYLFGGSPDALKTWPPTDLLYWGMSGGGGSGSGYQIQAFKPGSATHYTLFSGGGGGGAGNTTPEGEVGAISLINTGSGGGGGSQFGGAYLNQGDNLNGLGLGAGTGSGLSALEGTNIIFQAPPAVEYSFYPPVAHPDWSDSRVLTEYADNLKYLLDTLIPALYNQGYSIVVTGGGGGGTGLEFLDALGEEFIPHPVSTEYGFNFCYVFNKAGQYKKSDCVSASAVINNKLTLDQIIYQNIGQLFNQCMKQAILPENCHGYTDYTCTCTFQHVCVITELTNILQLNGFSSDDLPSWLVTPHCSNSETALLLGAAQMDAHHNLQSNQYSKALHGFFKAKNKNISSTPWDI
jgi:hypothetical protein